MQRAGLIRRNELIERLSDARDRQVTLVLAPAGYGKSAVLLEWASADPRRRFAWLTLEANENDPVLLWKYILFALRTLSPGLANEAWSLLRRPQPDLEEVMASLLNSLLDVPGRLVLVLDDYHVIANPQCHDSVQHFINHLPRSMHVALGTRTRPPISLSKFEADGSLLTINKAALQFTLEETRKAVEVTGRRLNLEDVTLVHERTEGWPAGVYLTAISGEARSVEGAHSGEVDSYLREQMLDHIPEGERTVLATWSILQHLNGDLCDSVANRNDSAIYLDRLSEANLLLMPLDPDGDWYRFHDLLREELGRELARLPAEQRRVAHRRAMDWWLKNGDTPRAIDHAIDAGAFDRAAELLCSHWFEYMLNGWLETLHGWIGRFPDEAILGYPPSSVAFAWISAFSGDVKATRRFAAAAIEGSFDGPMVDGSASYESAVAILRAGLGLEGMADANEHAELAYRLEPPGSPWRPTAAAMAGVTRFGLGRIEDARTALIEAAQAPAGELGLSTYARGQLGLLEMSEGNWEEGSQQAELAYAQINESNLGNLVSSGAACVAVAAAAAHIGNHTLASQRLQSLAPIQKVLSDAIPFDAFQIHLIAAETYLLLDNHRAASVHARTAAARLAAFGEAGIFEDRLAELQKTLMSDGSTDEDLGIEPPRLTDREIQILVLLQSDLSLREIAGDLFISRNTVKTHVASAYRKLNATGRTEAIARARQLDLL